MDTKVLYTLSIAIASVVGGFYYYSGKSEKLAINAKQDLSSNAKNIHIIQTTENGQLYAKTSISHMTLWMNSGEAELEKVQGMLYQNGRPNATFHADKAFSTDEYHQVELNGNIILTRLNEQQQPQISFKTDQLHGDTKSNQIKTDHLVYISNPQAKFTSQGLNVNLTTGQYEFFNIRGLYDPISQ